VSFVIQPHLKRAKWLASLAVASVAASVLVASGASARTASSAPTLVVDNSFTLKTSDPARAFDPTASIVDRAIYDTLFTYKGSNLTNPIPLLVSSWKVSKNAETFTFQLKQNVHFADGTPLTSADVVWSLQRLVNIAGNPSFLLAGISVSAPGKYTVVMKSKSPNTALPAILANPSTGILNSTLVKANGGTDAKNAAKADKAENWLNTSASLGAGSGPYTLSSFSTTSQVTVVPSTNYWGAKKPQFSSVVVRNMVAATQQLNVARGSHEVAIDLSADQANSLKSNKNLNVSLAPSTWIFFLYANDNPKISAVTSNKDYQSAIRYAIDYASLSSLAGPGAIQAPGVIPSMFLGSLPQSARVKTDLAKAKAALTASGDASQQVTLQYPSDLTINGVPFTSMAEKIQSSLQAAGFNVTLSGSPTSNFLDVYRSGKMALGLSLWGDDYPDPADYLVFTPGNLVGLRAGWPKGSDPSLEKLAAKAAVTTTPAARKAIYQQIQKALNQAGPFFPLIQPTQAFVSTKDLKGAAYNSVFQVDVTQVSPA
jgi:peptide/nickel transport system substrate-binding protein